MANEAFFSHVRRVLYRELKNRGVLSIDDNRIASNADKDSVSSRVCALHLGLALGTEVGGKRLAAQTLGVRFEEACANFVGATFPELAHLRPGPWIVERVKGRGLKSGVARFDQYKHLVELDRAVKELTSLQAIIGNDYAIAPEVVVFRNPISDSRINQNRTLIDESMKSQSSIRRAAKSKPTLHAMISCKWTLRSDRAQNARSEALNLIRNRKGRLPHISVVTAEPSPKRISSIALGTGDIDCVYHFALPELIAAVRKAYKEEEIDLLQTMVDGHRLRDITDLPLDLAS